MPRHAAVADRMASAVVKRLTVRKIAEIKDENTARAAIRQVVLENLVAEEQLDAEARKLLLDHAKQIKDSAADYRQLLGKVKEKLARERLFHLADQILKQLGTTPGVTFKAPDETRTEIIRALTEEAKLAESIDGEVRKILSSYSRPMPEGSREWEVLYEKTREEVFRKRFRL